MDVADVLQATFRTVQRRRQDQGSHDRAVIHAIIDEAMLCHVGFADAGSPVVLPAVPWRIGDWLYVHGAQTSRLLTSFSNGNPLCISLALIDGLVLARSALRHSLQYRSVVLFGEGEIIADSAEKAAALLALIDKLSPRRSQAVRPPTTRELDATGVARMNIREGSAKIAVSGTSATSADDTWPVWSGTVPVALRADRAVADERSVGLSPAAVPKWLVK